MKTIKLSQNRSINSIKLLNIPSYSEENGELVVLEEDDVVPFPIARVFVVNAEEGSMRGEHAHKECVQLLICLSGSVDVLCDDGKNIIEYTLTPFDRALLIPAGIWGVQKYKLENSSLMVLCNQPYNEDDYIRSYSQFKQWKHE
jgi:UDP-2-acetamido-3-amino-2,3-dideoxy-glucuronate N-acetyltransferase